ncbi:hypothetical protein BDD14_0502 [Edaphobacter modestus]|uniref:Uncharacterized protein n=1 Tax=Edaphobacter modestus TaxID=388466 RepID=A0A4Q7YP56_9BACT|nr:hypothetical protein BDD14_0502 [Edaphobacter modestus]
MRNTRIPCGIWSAGGTWILNIARSLLVWQILQYNTQPIVPRIGYTVLIFCEQYFESRIRHCRIFRWPKLRIVQYECKAGQTVGIAMLREHIVARRVRRFASKYNSKYCMLSGFGLWKLYPGQLNSGDLRNECCPSS